MTIEIVRRERTERTKIDYWNHGETLWLRGERGAFAVLFRGTRGTWRYRLFITVRGNRAGAGSVPKSATEGEALRVVENAITNCLNYCASRNVEPVILPEPRHLHETIDRSE